ncbi:MAG: hypothetical protein MZV63_46260 [Marinilabiliales bacterium]|nr:hypothetical protein [Marinilabiliales bacterium]
MRPRSITRPRPSTTASAIFCKLTRIEEDQYVWLDRFTIRNLELLTSVENAGTLLDVLDQTVSPMGSRQLRCWMILP